MNDIWKAVKPFKKNIKGSEHNVGYGFRKTNRRKYDRVEKRKIYRDIRKYGFDTSECWSLDCTIMEWLSDNVGGFFTQCGPEDNWGIADLDGNEWPINDDYDSEESHNLLKKCNEAEDLRCHTYEDQLKNLLDNCEVGLYDKFRNFVIPRLRYLSKTTHGWPASDKYPEFEDWTNAINEMADTFEQCDWYNKNSARYDERFIEDFWHLWD